MSLTVVFRQTALRNLARIRSEDKVSSNRAPQDNDACFTRNGRLIPRYGPAVLLAEPLQMLDVPHRGCLGCFVYEICSGIAL